MNRDTNIPPFMEEGLNAFKKYKFPGVDMETFLTSYQRNVEFINAAQQIATETTQSLMTLHNKFLVESFELWNEELKSNISPNSQADKTTRQAESSKAVIDRMIDHAREVHSTVEKSNEKLINSLQKRIKDSVDESVTLSKKSKKKS